MGNSSHWDGEVDMVRLSEQRKRLYRSLVEATGKTALVELARNGLPNSNRLFVKHEWQNPTGSTFDRLYPRLFFLAERSGRLIPGVTPVIEASTGNAGAAFARCARELGYNDATVVIHADAPGARIQQITSYGAKIVYAPAGEYAKGCVSTLQRILREDRELKGGRLGTNPERLYCITKTNPSGRSAFHSLAAEMVRDIGEFDVLMAAVGSGVTITGTGGAARNYLPNLRIHAADPSESPTTYTLKSHGRILDFAKMPHDVWGAGAYGLPLNRLNLDLSLIDHVHLVPPHQRDHAFNFLSQELGIEVGRTSCCVVAAALQLARRLSNMSIVTFIYDLAWKYGEELPSDVAKREVSLAASCQWNNNISIQ